MKNGLKLFWTIALVAVIAFSFAACEDDSGGGGGGGGGNGTFTITNIPAEYNGMYAYLVGGNGNVSLICGEGASWLSGGGKSLISNGSVSIPLWETPGNSRYSGNDADCFVDVMFQETNTRTESSYIGILSFSKANNNSVTFRGGSATRSWSDGRWRQS
jgi:hypothetical protein